MVTIEQQGFIKLANEDKNNRPYRRQDAPKCYDICANFYITRPNFVLNNSSFWDGNVKPFMVDKFRSIDIDDYYDYELVNYFYNNKICSGDKIGK